MNRVRVKCLDSTLMIDPFDGDDSVPDAKAYIGKCGDAVPAGPDGIWMVTFDDGKVGCFADTELQSWTTRSGGDPVGGGLI